MRPQTDILPARPATPRRSGHLPWRAIGRVIVAALALAAIVTALHHLQDATRGLSIARTRVGTTPVTVFRPATGAPAPVVVLAHGFAGSQQLMLPFATTLARNGYVVVTFDFPGHGRNPARLAGGLADDNAASAALVGSLTGIVAYARTLPEGDGHIALVGHSMASDTVVQVAQRDPGIDATVAVSVFARGVTADSPRNLLVVVGALEPAMLRDEGARIVGLVAGGPVSERVTYGSHQDGTARRLVLSPGVEHIGVLYSHESLTETLAWLNAVFGKHQAGFIDGRGRWLGLLFLGLVSLGWPLAALLPRVALRPAGAGLPWRHLLPVALVPAIVTPLVLWKLPMDFLPLLLGDYLAVHLALYGLLTAAGLWLVRSRQAETPPISLRALAVASVAVTLYAVLAIALPLDAYVTSFLPVPARQPMILAMLVGTLPFFVADEWLTSGAGAPRGAHVVTRLLFLLSIAAAIALNLHRLFFLIIIVPVIVVFFVIYGLFATWTYGTTRHPLPGALANAISLAWAIGVTFPMVAR